MPLTKLQFRPGINSEVTSYSNEGGWRDCDKIRFRFGYPEKLGGWSKYTDNVYEGSARALHNWIALDGSDFLGIGTHFKYYIEEGAILTDVTPTRNTTAAGDVTFSATDGSTTVTVTDASHGAQQNDYVTFSGAVSLGGVVTAAVLNKEYQITRVVDADTYEITLPQQLILQTLATAGHLLLAHIKSNVGLDTTVGGTGWGAGLYGGVNTGALQTTINEGGTFSNSDTTLTVTSGTGIVANDLILIGTEILKVIMVSTNDLTVQRGQSGTSAASHADGTVVTLIEGNADADDDYFGWGDAASGGLLTTTQIRLWSHDNFGEDLLLNPRDSNIYYWDKSNGTSTRAVELSTISGTKTSVPQIAKQVLVSDQDRHVIAFGCDGLGQARASTRRRHTRPAPYSLLLSRGCN